MHHNYQPSTLEYTQLVSIVYAIFSLSFGIVFPIAEALKDQWLNNVDNTIFLTFTLATSSVFLVYLLFYNLRINKKPKKSPALGFLKGCIFSIKSNICKKLSKCRNSTKNQNIESKIKIVIKPPSSSFKKIYKNKNPSSFVSVDSIGGFEMTDLMKRPSQRSLNNSDMLLNSKDVQPVTDIHLNPYKPYRRKSVCMTIREHPVEDYVGLEDSLGTMGRSKSHEQTTEKEEKEQDKSSLITNDENNNEKEDVENEIEPLTWVDADSFGSVFTHHGSNLFLRLGALVFGLGNMVNYALEIQANLLSNAECSNNMRFKWVFIWMFVFVFLQTFFIFKHSKINVTKHQSLVWLGMVHLILTNINLWIHSLAREIIVEYNQKIFIPNSTMEHENEKCDTNLLHSASIYLIPFVLEYSLIAVGIISSFLYCGVIEPASVVKKVNRNLIKVCSIAQKDFTHYCDSEHLRAQLDCNSHVDFEPMTHMIDTKKQQINDIQNENASLSKTFKNISKNSLSNPANHRELNSLQKSHAGLFAGMVVLCITVVTSVIFLFSQLQHNRAKAEIIYFSTDITIHSLLMIACVSACVKTRNLAFASKPVSTDDMLLLLAAFGSFTFELTNASALLTALRNSSEHPNIPTFVPTPFLTIDNGSNSTFSLNPTLHDLDPFHHIRDHLQLTSAFLGMAQTAVQTLLIFISLRRYSVTLNEITEMPGRGAMAFLIVGNLSVWILRTLLCKNILLPVQVNFFGQVGCMLLTDIHLPLLLFFRFHSSVCFADIWCCAYRLL